jgi:hypothetical protein
MKRQTVAVIAVSGVLTLSLATQAGAADARRTNQHPRGWLTQVVEWIAKKVQTVTDGVNVDRCGAIDPWGAPCA